MNKTEEKDIQSKNFQIKSFFVFIVSTVVGIFFGTRTITQEDYDRYVFFFSLVTLSILVVAIPYFLRVI